MVLLNQHCKHGIIFLQLLQMHQAACILKRLDKCWADLKIIFDDEAPLTTEFNYTQINTLSNIDFDGALTVEENAKSAHYKTCRFKVGLGFF